MAILTCRRSRGRRRGSSRPLRGPLSPGRISRCRSAPWGGRTRECSRAALRRRTSTGPALPERRRSGAVRCRGHHRGERALGPDAAAARLGPLEPSAGPIRTPSDWTTWVSYAIGQHRHLVAALRTGVDDRERAALGRTDGLQLHRAVAGDAEELHREAPSLIRGCPEVAARRAPGPGRRVFRAVPREGSPDRSAGQARDRMGRSRGRGSPGLTRASSRVRGLAG